MVQYIDSNLFNTIPTTAYKITFRKSYGKQQEIVNETCKFILNSPKGSGKSTALMKYINKR